MDIVELNKLVRAHPVIKQAIGRGAPPEPRALYDAVRELTAQYPIFHRFVADFGWLGGRYFLEQEYTNLDFFNYGTSKPDNQYLRDVRALAKALSRAAKGAVSPETRRTLLKWVHNNSSHPYIGALEEKELRWVQGIHPEVPVKLYRGLLFYTSNWTSDRVVATRDARVFVNALLAGHTEFVLDHNRAQSWTVSPDIANRFATKNAATSEYGAMMNWLHNGKKFIDRDLGLIISAVVQPEDIVCDLGKIDLGHMAHGNEGEYIVRSGAHLKVKIEHIYTKTGEINPEHFVEFINNIAKKAA